LQQIVVKIKTQVLGMRFVWYCMYSIHYLWLAGSIVVQATKPIEYMYIPRNETLSIMYMYCYMHWKLYFRTRSNIPSCSTIFPSTNYFSNLPWNNYIDRVVIFL